jgi:hypothetical protein
MLRHRRSIDLAASAGVEIAGQLDPGIRPRLKRLCVGGKEHRGGAPAPCPITGTK